MPQTCVQTIKRSPRSWTVAILLTLLIGATPPRALAADASPTEVMEYLRETRSGIRIRFDSEAELRQSLQSLGVVDSEGDFRRWRNRYLARKKKAAKPTPTKKSQAQIDALGRVKNRKSASSIRSPIFIPAWKLQLTTLEGKGGNDGGGTWNFALSGGEYFSALSASNDLGFKAHLVTPISYRFDLHASKKFGVWKVGLSAGYFNSEFLAPDEDLVGFAMSSISGFAAFAKISRADWIRTLPSLNLIAKAGMESLPIVYRAAIGQVNSGMILAIGSDLGADYKFFILQSLSLTPKFETGMRIPITSLAVGAGVGWNWGLSGNLSYRLSPVTFGLIGSFGQTYFSADGASLRLDRYHIGLQLEWRPSW